MLYCNGLLQAFAQETSSPERFRSGLAVIHITLLDLNDNSPVFSQSTMYRFNVNISSPVNSLIGQVGGNFNLLDPSHGNKN